MLSLLGSDGLWDYVQIVISNIFGSILYLSSWSNSCMFSVAVFYFGQVICCNSKREHYAWLWVRPLMSSLSDRNMRLGDVLLPPGIKQRCLYLRVQGLFTLRKVILMQLSVALSLHIGRDSHLNTSEMFWIDISRWMIRSRCRWISVYLPWRTSHCFWALPLCCTIVSIAVPS